MDLLREKLRAQGHHKAQVAAVMAGSAIVGGAISAGASKSAANTQANAANNATAMQKGMFDQQMGLEAPFQQAGAGAMGRLSYLMGIGSPTATGGPSGAPSGTSATAAPQETLDQIRERLAPQYPGAGPSISLAPGTNLGGGGWNSGSVGSNSALEAAAQAEFQKQQQSPTPSTGGLSAAAAGMAGSVPGGDYGSLLKPFGTSDFQLDPGIQFQTQQGNLALQNSQAAKDGVLSGAALKDLIGFNQGMAGTGYQSAFDRYMANKQFTLGSLMDVANTGQSAAANVGNVGAQYSRGISGTITGAGNATAAGTVGSANAISGGMSGASNGYLLNSLLKTGSTPTDSYGQFSSSPMSDLIYSSGSLGD